MSGKTKGAAASVAAGTTGAAKNSLLMQKMPLVDLVALIFLSVLAVVCVGVGGGWRAGLHFVPTTLFPGVDAEVSTSSKTMKLKGQLHQEESYFRKLSVEEGKSWLELEQYLFLTIMFTLCFVMSNTLRRLTAVGGNELAGGAAMKAKAKKGGGFFSQRKKKLKEAKGKESAEAEQEKTRQSQTQPQQGNDTSSEPAETEKEMQLRERSTRKGRKADDRVDPRVLEFEKSIETATAASSEATRPTPATPSSNTPAASTRPAASDQISSSGAKQKTTAFVSDAAPAGTDTPVLTKSSGDAPAPKKASKSAKKKNKSTVDKGLLQDYLDEEAVDDVGTGPAVDEEDEDEDCERPSLNYMKFALSSSAGPRAVNVTAEEPAGVVGLATTTEATNEDEEFDFGAGEKQDRENVPDSPKLSVAEQRALAEKERKDRELKALEDWKLEKARLEKESKGKKAHPDVGVSSSKPSGVTPGRQTAPGGSKDQHATTPGSSSFSEEQKRCMKIQKKLMQILKLERDFEYEQLDELQKEKMAQKEQLLEEFEEARKSWKVKEEEDRQQQLLLEMDKIVRELSPSFKKKKAAQELRKRQAAAGGSSVLEQAAGGGGGADGENKGRRNSITKTGQSASTSKKQDQYNKSGRGRRDQSSSQAREHQHRGRRNEERSATSSNRKYGRKSQSQVNTFFDPTIKPRKNEVPKATDFPSLLNDSADVSLLLQPSEGGDMSFVDLSAGASGGAENANATTTNSTAAAAEGGAGGTTWAARLRSATTGTNLEAEGRRDRAATVDDDEVPPPPPDDSGDDEADDPHEKKDDVLDDKRFPKKSLATKEELLTASMKKKRRETRRTVSHSPPDRAESGVYLAKFRASEPNASGYGKSSFGKSTSGKGVAKGNKGSWSKGSKVNMKGGGERDKDNQNYYGGGGKTWSGPRRGMMMPPQTSRKWAFPPDSAIDPFYVRGYNDYSFVPPPPPIAASLNTTPGGPPTASPDTNSSASCGGGEQDSLQSTGPLPSGVLLEMPLVMPTGERAYDLNQSRTSTTNCGNETNETMNQSLTLNQSVLSNTSQSSAMPYNQRGGGAANSAPGANPNTTSNANLVNPNPPRSPPNVPFAEETGAVGMNTPAVVGGGGAHQNLQSCDQYSLQQKPMPRGVMLPGTAGSMGKQPIVTTVEKTSWDVSWV